jgi:hypothetical protein
LTSKVSEFKFDLLSPIGGPSNRWYKGYSDILFMLGSGMRSRGEAACMLQRAVLLSWDVLT